MPSGVVPLTERLLVCGSLWSSMWHGQSWLYTDLFGFHYNRRSCILREIYSGTLKTLDLWKDSVIQSLQIFRSSKEIYYWRRKGNLSELLILLLLPFKVFFSMNDCFLQCPRAQGTSIFQGNGLESGLSSEVPPTPHPPTWRGKCCRCIWYWIIWWRGHQRHQGTTHLSLAFVMK